MSTSPLPSYDALPKQVRIVEVGPRDGLQNETMTLEAAQKIQFIENLIDAGVTNIEAASFVNPKWVPQMANSEEVMAGIQRRNNVNLSALTPNMKGYERAVSCGAHEVAVFTAASEAFNQKNINCSIAESIERFQPVLAAAKEQDIPVRGYISCVVGCPYGGDVEPSKVREVTETLLAMGCYEVSLGDTIGVGTPRRVRAVMRELYENNVPLDKIAVHFHNTYGQAIANIYEALCWGINVVDSSAAGLGGCPYAKGATGNVATEDVVYLLNDLGIETGIDLEKLIAAGNAICAVLGISSRSNVANALTK